MGSAVSMTLAPIVEAFSQRSKLIGVLRAVKLKPCRFFGYDEGLGGITQVLFPKNSPLSSKGRLKLAKARIKSHSMGMHISLPHRQRSTGNLIWALQGSPCVVVSHLLRGW